MLLARILLCLTILLPCSTMAGRAIFYQPQQRDLELAESRWPVIFSEARAKGMDTLIVQWTAYGEVFASEPKRAWLKSRLDEAIKAGMTVIIGLNADPDVFTRLEQPATVLGDYFRQQRRLDTDLAKYWLSVLPNNQIAGWYITLEVDDRRWRDTKALDVLKAHLQTEVSELKAVGNQPVYISSFFAGNMAPTNYVDMLSQLRQESKIQILVQDGAGTAKLTDRERALYLNALSDCKAPVAQGVVYEIFKQIRHDQAFLAEPVAPQALAQILQKRAPCGQDTVLFSLRYLIEFKQSVK
jgi:hypothetical protein